MDNSGQKYLDLPNDPKFRHKVLKTFLGKFKDFITITLGFSKYLFYVETKVGSDFYINKCKMQIYS